MHPRPELVAGFDIGGTKVLGLVVRAGEIELLASAREATAPTGPELVTTIVGMLEQLEDRVGGRVAAVGVGVAGLVSDRGVVRYSPNIPGVVEFDLASALGATALGDRLERPLRIDNDANVAAFAEARSGAGAGVDDQVFVGLGTGIGTGLVVGGRLLRGAHGFAGESGHMVIDVHGPRHVTDARGPWEYHASGDALGRMARDLVDAGGWPAALARVGSVAAVDGEQVGLGLAAGEPEARGLLDEFARWVAVGLANLVYVLDPALVVLGGGVIDLGEPLRAAVEAQLAEVTLGAEHRPPVPVRLAELGPAAGALGAALLASEV